MVVDNTDVYAYVSPDAPDLNVRQFYDLEVITAAGTTKLLDDAPVAPSFTGNASFPIKPLPRGWQVLRGPVR